MTDKKNKMNPHLALCHESQGFSANNRHVSLLMKSDALDDVTKAALERVLEKQKIEKAMFYSQQRTLLQDAVKEKYGDDKEWLYVEDFNDSVVIFCNESGIFSASYSLSNGEVVLDDLANPVTSVISYVPASGKMLLSEDAEDKLEEGVYGLVSKAVNSPESVEHFKQTFECIEVEKQNKVKLLEQEIQKAVEQAEAVLKAQLVEKEEALQKALSKLEEIEKAAKEAVEKSRKDKLAELVSADEVDGLFKAVGGLEEEAFEAVVKTLEKKAQVEKESDLMKEVGVSGEGDAPKQEEAGLALVGELIKSKKKQ